jgi:hypothetical protein
MKVAALLLAFLAAFSVSARPKDIQPPKGFARTLYNATFALYTTDGMGDDTFACTATIFQKTADNGYNLLSAGHCVGDVPANVGFAVSEKIGGPRTPVTIVRARRTDDLDFAIFHLQTKKIYPVISLGSENDSRIGDKTLNVNFTFGMGKQYAPGIVASQTMGVTQRCSLFCVGRFMDHMYGSSGASGSAVVSERTHEIIGIVVSSYGDTVGLGIEDISLYAKFMALPDDQKQLHAAAPPEVVRFFQ